ncbi:hypothetical protein BU24DRAFT_78125 [Aaosphaeria arxii CBS 175.79]|uniref:HBS1-like protein N-terminal domain-containing protein n=1 Tax=Aaosphaeria arxii CBS 175.79 TaxID=1450172 RepID=A0A6A5X9J1_9PLEO|nr:uncharacterized protein BU24DRAFT_78125 [Aaosphaeria arxii CBS 175.79]KAF2009556.1 hypothetical protein BU24DRAFT_78125 [Aaosphaeria arxii CBS 175.79]
MPPKSGHQRAKNVDYDDDDVYDDDDYYEEEDGGNLMSDEDREQMRLGTIKVREALDSSTNVTDAQIQEALWNYYYDVGKSVTYLKNKFAPKAAPQPKKQKPVSRFDQAASAAGAEVKTTPGKLFHFIYYITSHHAPHLSRSHSCARMSMSTIVRSNPSAG